MTWRILVTGAGGSPATNFVRSLRAAPRSFYIVGTDADPYYLCRAETDVRHLVPRVSDPDYLTVLNQIVREQDVDLIHAQNDTEVGYLSEHRDELAASTFLPAPETVRICQDKLMSYARWAEAGVPVPRTVQITGDDDLVAAFADFGGEVWVRATTGAGGRGSLAARDVATARAWLDMQGGWDGTYTVAELLTTESVTWMSVWHEGELVVAQTRRRLYWELSKLSPSGVTGATGGGETCHDDAVDEIARNAVLAIDPRPHGLFGVDMTYDRRGVPNPTEINIGRFFTTHHFFTELGLNLPLAFVQLALGEAPDLPSRRLNPLPDGRLWIRGMDFEPVLASRDDVTSSVDELAARRERLSR